jgi:hypothetical protein
MGACNVHEKEDEKTWRNYDNSLSFNYQAGQIFHLLLQEVFKNPIYYHLF